MNVVSIECGKKDGWIFWVGQGFIEIDDGIESTAGADELVYLLAQLLMSGAAGMRSAEWWQRPRKRECLSRGRARSWCDKRQSIVRR